MVDKFFDVVLMTHLIIHNKKANCANMPIVEYIVFINISGNQNKYKIIVLLYLVHE